MKKLLTLVVVTSVLILTACGVDDVAPTAGVFTDNVYINESVGLQFQLPRGWDFLNEQEIADATGIGAEVLSALGSDFTNNDVLNRMEESPLHDMMATNHFDGTNVQVMFQRLPRSARNASTQEELEKALEEFEDSGLNMVSTMNPGQTRIGSYDFYSANLEIEFFPGFYMAVRMFLRLDGRNMTMVNVTALNQSMIDDILNYFGYPGATLIEIPELESAAASDLIGAWVWNMDEDYQLIFNADRTGIRGYIIDSIDELIDLLAEELDEEMIYEFIDEFGVDDLWELFAELWEEFEWELVDGVLYLDFEYFSSFGGFHEEWIATIDDDVLSIENIHPGGVGLAFSYIRQ